MAIKEILQRVIAQLSGDNAEALKAELRQGLIEVDTILESKQQSDGESKSRKEKLRQAEADLLKANEEIEKLKGNQAEFDRLKAVETEYLTHKKTIADTQLADWKNKQAKLQVDKTHKDYDRFTKLASRFSFIEDGKELTEAQISDNLKQYSLLEDAGFFGVQEAGKQEAPKYPGGNETNNEQKSGSALFNNLKTQ